MSQNPRTRAVTPRTVLTVAAAAATSVALAGATVMGFAVMSLLDYHSASQRYISAYESRTELAEGLNSALDDRDHTLDQAQSDLLATQAILLAADDAYVGSAEKAALVVQHDSLVTAVAAGGDDSADPAPDRAALPRDASTAELTDAARTLEAEVDEITAETTEATTTTEEVTAALDDLQPAGQSFMDALPAVAQAVLDANPSATNDTRIALKSDAKTLGSGSSGWNRLDDTFVTFIASAKAVQASQVSEEAEKAGPLYAARTEIEAYARSIAGGAAIDFDWAPVVIGYGEGGSMAGTSGCDVDPSDDSYYSTITLTNSVASYWGNDSNARALVTHEVGHTITCKCWDIFEANAGGDYEAWATAWAIGMGFEEEGNGTQAYGRPSDALIDAARACR
jgi:hypothetical protein